MSFMSLMFFVLFGFVIGLVARALLPGKQTLGLLWTTLLGIAGSLAGGLVTRVITGASSQGLQPAGFLGSLVGAFILLWGYVAFTRRKSRGTHA
jgi:uncharacterized membrane protein YeaQ/YmgE (transglycosylase-associated protein family)